MRITRADAYPSGGVERVDLRAPAASDVSCARWLDGPTTERQLPFVELLGILRRSSGLILGVTFTGALMAGTIGLLIPPKYTATAQIIVEPQQVEVVGGRVSAPWATDESAIDTQVAMLTSPDHLQHVLESLPREQQILPTEPKAEVESAPGDRKQTRPADTDRPVDILAPPGGPLDELGRRLKVWFGVFIPHRNAAARELDELQRRLKVMQERRSRVISVSFTATSPTRAAAVANRIVELRITSQANERRAQTTRELARLGERAVELKADIEQSGRTMRQLLERRLAAGVGDKEDELRLRELEQAAAAKGQAYAGLLRRQKELRDQQENIAADAHILSQASPPGRPSSPNPILFILPALIASSICGALLAVIVERLDQGLRSDREVTDALGIPCIGMLPRLSRLPAAQSYQYLLSKPFTPYAEAVRSAVAALQLTTTERGAMTLLVSSSIPQEGKTTVAISLAVHVALLKRRVLLVDLDFRRPSVLRELREPERLIPDLRGRPATDHIQHLSDLNLDYLAMPRPSVDPLTLFADGHMRGVLRQLRDLYDCVIIDGPPLLGVAEARLLAPMVDKVLFVIKWRGTRRPVAQNALALLRNPGWPDSKGIAEPVALMAQVNLKAHAKYRFGDVGESLASYRTNQSVTGA